MKNKAVELVASIVLAALVAGCGGGEQPNTIPTSTTTVTPVPSDTPQPTETPTPLLPDSSIVTLEPVLLTNDDDFRNRGLYVADASTGKTFHVKTAPGPVLLPSTWLSPTQLVAQAWTQSDRSYYLLDIDAKTLRRLPVSADNGAVSFAHSGDLMTSIGPAGELVISTVADNREVARITNGPTSLPNWGPYISWAPDDKHIFFRSAGSTAGSIASVEATPVVIAAETPGDNTIVNWTPNGSAVVFANADGVFSIDAMSGETTVLYSLPAGIRVQPDSLALSPYGRYAVVGTRDGPQADALVVPLDGRTQGIRITNIEMLDVAWSTTNDLLAVIADRCTPESRLLLVNPDGGVRAAINGARHLPRFSKDDTMLAYIGEDPSDESGDTWGTVVVSSSGEFISFISGFGNNQWWSPDGHWIAYSSSDWPPYLNSCVGGLPKTEILPFP